MKRIYAWNIVVLFLLVAFGGVSAQEERTVIGGDKNVMARLAPQDIALSMYGSNLTWGDLLKLMKRDGVRLEKDGKGDYMYAPIQEYLQQLVRNAIALQAARQQGIVLSDAEHALYLDGIKKALKDKDENLDVDQFLARYPEKSTSLFDFSIEDLLLIAWQNSKLVESAKVSDTEVEEELNHIKAGNIAVVAFNEQMKEKLEGILAKPESKTDEGFAQLARENSEGREAADGGVLKGEFPRDFIAKACELDEFNLKEGETSGVLESRTAFRAFRVLKVLPPEKEGGDEMLRLAQIILPKFPESEEIPPEQMREQLTGRKRMKILEEFAVGQMVAARFACPLFPQGLMNAKEDKQK